ncbi:trans-aconitate 2-methyltransferase [Actinoplanes sp. SE50]|uniref:trans-aconitate 2-methyltransferase n=1 Tax=unclassified Actinoplanes TaxID=2626549 RepID=UPI00023EBE0B|nr:MULTISPECIES: trans-aconitate 2-methyltransferase [unclassified Actinoplanes]AEV87441.1 trans-aconitate 2-methyltransferase [Actinoplanes sp. SE50/110]ATO85843.1 trans-aconitate 2-methyltransferase [Actinoplanes sp. SE50]SLM03257.1 trans-aconitate 2-methyltransferase [Actinoplanes sp. SE50/110]
MWDPAVYQRYGTERSRPFFDLTTRIGARRPREVVDLGCGFGDLTRTLAERWPAARITGIDSSPEMIAAATGGDFRVGDIADWTPGPDTDVVVTNAALQWVPGHQRMLTRWVRELPAGAWLAMQVPGNFGAPSHRLLREVAAGHGVERGIRESPVDEPTVYAESLTAAGAAVDAWETTYVHLLPVDGPDHPVLRWMEGTALRPVRAALTADAWTSFRAELGARLAEAYPTGHAHVAFPFRRIFVVASI